MSSIRIDSNNDLDFSTGGLVIVTSTEAIAQKVKIRLQFFLGEWFLDTRLGVPYFQQVFVKNPKISTLQTIFRGVVVNTPGIDRVEQFSLALDPATRKLTVTFLAKTAAGETIDFNEEFVIA